MSTDENATFHFTNAILRGGQKYFTQVPAFYKSVFTTYNKNAVLRYF